nr:PilZ domain-containing protein [Motilibacter aurantiacus]
MKLWRVRPAGSVELRQRRRYARVEVNGALSVVNPEVDTIRVGWMLDLGEGGVRCRVAPGAFKADEPVECRLNVDGDVLVVHGTVLRAEKPVNGYEELVVTFPDDHPAADLVRKHVFAEQLRARRAATAGGQA